MKEKYSATFTEATYIGNHKPIKGTIGKYYWNIDQNAFVYRPHTEEKSDWYRVHKKNLVDTPTT